MDRGHLKAKLVAEGAESLRRMPELCEEIRGLLQRRYPLHMLAVLAGYGLQSTVTAEGVSSGRIMSGIEQHHVELLQALTLTVPRDQWGQLPAKADEIQQVIDRLGELANAFYRSRFLALAKEGDAEQRAVLLLQERLRGHTQFVRNWGYHGSVVEISRELYCALDSELRAGYGFGATEVIDLAQAMLVCTEQQASERFMMLGRVTRCETCTEMVHTYFRECAFVQGDPEEFLRQLPAAIGREQLACILMAHADLQLPSLATVDLDRMAHAVSRDHSVVVRVLERLSLTTGSLSSDDIPKFFMGNPVWGAPGIKDGLAYFLPMPQLVFSHVHSIMRSLLSDLKPSALEKLARTRASYLEAKVSSLLGRAFPMARLSAGITWSVGENRYETDLLLIIDRTVLIVEAKSASLTAQGLRGAPDRVKRHVQELLVDPAVQSDRLAHFIREASGGDAASQQILDQLGIDGKAIDRIIRLSVTLDDFSILASCEAELKGAGWVPSDLELAPTLNLADLGCVVDILEEPAFILHYLSNRGHVQRSTGLLGDELDYLGFYLQTAFGMPEVERSDAIFAIAGMSAPIDHYYNSHDAGVSVPKPPLQLPETLRRMILEVQRRAGRGWATVSLALLDIAYSAADGLDEELMTLKLGVSANPHDPQQPRGVAILPPSYSDTLVAFYVFPEVLSARRGEAAGQFANDLLEATGKTRCVVVGRMIEEWHRPYQFTAMVCRA
jgi:hypothetical protein